MADPNGLWDGFPDNGNANKRPSNEKKRYAPGERTAGKRLSLIGKNGQRVGEAELRHIFHVYDVDGSGTLTLEEFVELINDMRASENKPRVNKMACKSIFDVIDVDQNNEMDCEEFLLFFREVDKLQFLKEELDIKEQKQQNQKLIMICYFLVVFL